jgi:hypothetical protein
MKKEIDEEEKADLVQSIKNSDKAEKLSDAELIDAVCTKCEFDLCGYEQALIDELVIRYQTKINLDRPTGIPIDPELKASCRIISKFAIMKYRFNSAGKNKAV